MSASLDPVAASFSQAASDFTRLEPYLWGPVGAATAALAGQGLSSDARVLDACCGVGSSAIPVAAAVSDGWVDAVDLAPELIALLRDRPDRPERVRPHVADVVTWPGGGYDLVQCVLGIPFLPDVTAASRRLAGRARPGGRVAFTIWAQGRMADIGRRVQEAACEARGEAAPPPEARTPHLVESLGAPDTYRRWLSEEVHLADVEVATAALTVDLVGPGCDEVAWLLVTGSGFRAMLAGLDDTGVARAREHYLAGLARDGVTSIDATTLVGLGRRE